MSSAPPPPLYTGNNNYYQQGPPPMVQPIYMAAPIMGDYPVQCICPQCGNRVVTRVEQKAGLFAWLICAVLFFTLMWVCCCIPFCVDVFKDTEHYCPACNAMLGISKKI